MMGRTKQHSRTILIAAGASGGHIFPALSVAEELKAMGFACVFVGGGKQFDVHVGGAGYPFEVLPAAPWNVRNPLRKLLAIFKLAAAMAKAMYLIHKHKPSVVFGTGGYATVATVMAGWISGVPTMMHEQNVLPGRASRFLSRWVDRVLLSFPVVEGSLKTKAENTRLVGNPVRQQVLAARCLQRPEDGLFRLLVVGGSQGSRILSQVVPKAVGNLPPHLREKLVVIQQARPEDVEEVTNTYTRLGVAFKVQSFFSNLPKQLAESNLLVGRSGAGTVVECALLGRAAVLVPLELADGHQILNAQVLVAGDAAIMVREKVFSAEYLATLLGELMQKPERLAKMEQNALALAHPDAARLAAMQVVELAKMDVMSLRDDLKEETDVA